jgi:hypothetical protein
MLGGVRVLRGGGARQRDSGSADWCPIIPSHPCHPVRHAMCMYGGSHREDVVMKPPLPVRYTVCMYGGAHSQGGEVRGCASCGYRPPVDCFACLAAQTGQGPDATKAGKRASERSLPVRPTRCIEHTVYRTEGRDSQHLCL